MDNADHPLYENFWAYISRHPLPYQEHNTRLNLFCFALAGNYLKYTVGKYQQEQKETLQMVLDIIHLRELYRKLDTILGSEENLERLNLVLCQRFMFITPMAAFLEGLTNDLLNPLTKRDMERSKLAVHL